MAEFKKINIDGQDLDIHAKFADMDANGKAVDSYVAGATLTGTDLNLYDGNALPVGSPIDLSGIGGGGKTVVLYGDHMYFRITEVRVSDGTTITTWQELYNYIKTNTPQVFLVYNTTYPTDPNSFIISSLLSIVPVLTNGYGTPINYIQVAFKTYPGHIVWFQELPTDNIVNSYITDYCDRTIIRFNTKLSTFLNAPSTPTGAPDNLTQFGLDVSSISKYITRRYNSVYFAFLSENGGVSYYDYYLINAFEEPFNGSDQFKYWFHVPYLNGNMYDVAFTLPHDGNSFIGFTSSFSKEIHSKAW